MTKQNKKMYYLFSIAAVKSRMRTTSAQSLVVLFVFFFFFCLCGTWFSSFESYCQNYVYSTHNTVPPKGKGKTCLCLVVEQSFY